MAARRQAETDKELREDGRRKDMDISAVASDGRGTQSWFRTLRMQGCTTRNQTSPRSSRSRSEKLTVVLLYREDSVRKFHRVSQFRIPKSVRGVRWGDDVS